VKLKRCNFRALRTAELKETLATVYATSYGENYLVLKEKVRQSAPNCYRPPFQVSHVLSQVGVVFP